MALVVSLMVAFVILMLSTVVVAQSIHSLNASGYDRQRLTSYNAAEAGANAWWEDLQTTALASLNCSTKAGVMNTQPNEAQYSASATFYAADGSTAMACPLSSANPPSYVKIVSTGSSEGEAARAGRDLREADPDLHRVRSRDHVRQRRRASGTTSRCSVTAGSDGDIYILNGNLSITNSPVIWGSVYVPNGSLSMSNSSEIKGNIWSNGSASLTTVGWLGQVDDRQHLRRTRSVGDATATGTITSSVAGTKYPGTNPGPVPTQTFPQIANSTTAWTNAGYTLVGPYTGASACTNAYNYIHNTGSGTWATSGLTNIVIQINATCAFSNGNNDTITIRGNLAVISDGGFTFSQQSNWNASSTVKNALLHQRVHVDDPVPVDEEHLGGEQHELQLLRERVLLHALHGDPVEPEQLHRPGAGGHGPHRQQVHDDLQGRPRPRAQGTVSGFTQDIAYVREI